MATGLKDGKLSSKTSFTLFKNPSIYKYITGYTRLFSLAMAIRVEEGKLSIKTTFSLFKNPPS